jgi:hypothetical protein
MAEFAKEVGVWIVLECKTEISNSGEMKTIYCFTTLESPVSILRFTGRPYPMFSNFLLFL